MFLLGFCGWLRRSEIIALKNGDVVFKTMPDGTECIELSIRKSQNDQLGKKGHIWHICASLCLLVLPFPRA